MSNRLEQVIFLRKTAFRYVSFLCILGKTFVGLQLYLTPTNRCLKRYLIERGGLEKPTYI